uniref:Uncharacterized protein n=1 Tax=Oryza glumipatula TaxID=40148 RepID=A0A0D9YMB4_9ORYZ
MAPKIQHYKHKLKLLPPAPACVYGSTQYSHADAALALPAEYWRIIEPFYQNIKMNSTITTMSQEEKKREEKN